MFYTDFPFANYEQADYAERLEAANVRTAHRIGRRLMDNFLSGQTTMVVRGGWLGLFRTSHGLDVYEKVAGKAAEQGLEIVVAENLIKKEMGGRIKELPLEEVIHVISYDEHDVSQTNMRPQSLTERDQVYQRQLYPPLKVEADTF